MTFHIITIFPNIFDSYFNESIIKRAQKNKALEIRTYNLRDYTEDKHKSVDDTPFGGGAGMLMKIEPLYNALSSIKLKILFTDEATENKKIKTILLSAKGDKWTQEKAQKYSKKFTDIILICGRYEGVDERITNFIDEEISIGDYVLTGGEIGSMVLLDSITRLLPGVLGNAESSIEESHSKPGVLEYPQYTRPEIFIDKQDKSYKVPEILLSGNHAKIKEWRERKLKIKD